MDVIHSEIAVQKQTIGESSELDGKTNTFMSSWRVTKLVLVVSRLWTVTLFWNRLAINIKLYSRHKINSHEDLRHCEKVKHQIFEGK